MIDIYAPIVPYEGLGGLKLYSTLEEVAPLLRNEEIRIERMDDDWTRYEIVDTMYLFFHNKNGKLWKLCALDDYKGKLFGKIGTDITEEELVAIDNSFVYDEFEEVFESPKGVYIESDQRTHKIYCISVFIKELNELNFEEARW